MKHLTVGILAHVDAGKTTLSECMLYLSGRIRSLGRVDHKSTYLDTNPMERERGITIFSKQARMTFGDTELVLLDTPGHTDFSAETERALQVLDYAILVISAADGVQNHTLTLWQLLRTYHVPTFLFINKTDLPTDPEPVLAAHLQKELDPACIPFFTGEEDAALAERLAVCDEALLEQFLSDGTVDWGIVASQIAERRIFPCFFGSALRMKGVAEFLHVIDTLTMEPLYNGEFAAKVYKIGYDGNTRLTWMKVTGGCLSVRDEIAYRTKDGKTVREKVAQLRFYSGEKFTQTEEAAAGSIVTAIGLTATFAGQGLGCEPDGGRPILEPVLSYRLCLPEGCDVRLYYPKFKLLEEEDPALRLTWEEELREIHAGLMGEVQIDVLKRMIKDRFGIDIEVDTGRILYKETIAKAVEGVGHFEPLRHYAEVHLKIEPLPPGSGLVFARRCPEGMLETNWQRLVLGHLADKTHRGVLTGAPLTDCKITLIAGRAHAKHTDGGDFREATHRAVRQGLMTAESVLLEPYYHYRLEIPGESTGRAMSDLTLRSATVTVESGDESRTVLTGRVPAASIGDYVREVISYTHGEGRLVCTFEGWFPCHNTEEVVAAAGYLPERDLENTPHSVFCAHGAGFIVPWNEVRAHMHVDSGWSSAGPAEVIPSVSRLAKDYKLDEEELEAIMLREFGPIRRRSYSPAEKGSVRHVIPPRPKRKMLVADGYNLIFQWDPLRELAEDNLEHARERLMDILDSYVGFTKTELVLVFDAYNVRNAESREYDRGLYKVVFTAENETADTYIERFIHSQKSDTEIRVVTSDRLIQLSAVHAGASRMSAREFIAELTRVGAEITAYIEKLADQKA